MREKIILLLFVVCVAGHLIPYAQKANVDDSLAIAEVLSDYPHEKPLKDWWGIKLDADGRVIQFATEYRFYKTNNRLPKALAKLVKLRVLGLGGVNLSGPIPIDILSRLTELTVLDLHSNNLTGPIPVELMALTNLEVLNLTNNSLTGVIPQQLASLGKLRSLTFSKNHLTGVIPAQLGSLKKLQYFYAGYNNLQGPIPAWVTSQPLTELVLAGNNFTFEGMEGVADIKTVVYAPQGNTHIHFKNAVLTVAAGGTLSNNSYTWYKDGLPVKTTDADSTYMPVTAGSYAVRVINKLLPQFILYSDTIAVKTIVKAAATVSKTTVQPGNKTTGSILTSDSLALIQFYKSANGPKWKNSANWVTGPVNTWYGITVNSSGRVTRISLPANGLTGSISPETGKLSALTYLNLPNNQFEGGIPKELGNLNMLDTLNLYFSNLNGEVPAELGKLLNLTYLNIGLNWLGGSLPAWPGGLGKLLMLDMAGNNFTGVIPPALGNLTHLEGLFLSGTRFLSGTIPTSLGKLAKLKWLYLDHCQLNGEIPASIGNLVNLLELDLSTNKLTGNLPAAIGNCTKLASLNVNFNMLSGPLPSTLGSLTQLKTLYLNDNNFSGNIPQSFNGLTKITASSVSNNYFTFNELEPFAEKIWLGGHMVNVTHPVAVNFNKGLLSVSAGGTLSNNTYTWYKTGAQVKTVTSDSTFAPTQPGTYTVEVTNSKLYGATISGGPFTITAAMLQTGPKK